MMMPEVACCRMAFESRRIPAGFYEASKVFIAVDCRILFRGEWAALDELLTIQTDVTVIWLTRPDTGLMLPRARWNDRRVDQFLGLRAMRRALRGEMDKLQESSAEPLQTLTMKEYQVLPYFLADISIATISKVTGIAEKTLYSHRRHILLKAGFRLWCYFQHIHQKNPTIQMYYTFPKHENFTQKGRPLNLQDHVHYSQGRGNSVQWEYYSEPRMDKICVSADYRVSCCWRYLRLPCCAQKFHCCKKWPKGRDTGGNSE